MPNSTGHIAQVVGPVVDVHFDIAVRNAEIELPRIEDALVVKRPDGRNLILEVQQHIGEDTVRCVAMDSTDGLRSGAYQQHPGQCFAGDFGQSRLDFGQKAVVFREMILPVTGRAAG